MSQTFSTNETIKLQMNHRSIREFRDTPIPPEIFRQIMEVGRHTASSTGMQSCSIIRVTDQELRKEIAQVCQQEYVARAPELLIFIVDVHRNAQIAREQGEHLDSERDMDRFFQGFTDAVLMAQNMTIAIESLNMGAVYFGSILNDTDKIIELLQLPELTFPVVGMGFGYPNQEPQIKPRMEMELRVFENSYQKAEDYLEALAPYDEVMQTYYDLRNANQRVDSFTKQVVARLKGVIPKRQKLVSSIEKQGFDLKLEK